MYARAGITTTALLVLGATVVTLAVGGCGNSTTPHAAPVKLSQLSPADGTRVSSDRVTVTGIVGPRHGSVIVLGRHVQPAGDGRFSATVPLQVGTNLIDVIAEAAHARPAMTAIRVVRYVLVSVPNVQGRSPRAAATAISAAGLRPKIDGSSDPLSFLIPLSDQVCSQKPAPHARVSPGTTVTLSVGKLC